MAFAALVIDINARLARFESDLNKVAQISKRHADQMDRAFAKVGGTLRTLGGAVSLGAISAIGAGIFKMGAEAERAALQLDAALKATGGGARVLRGELNQIADEIKVRTVFDDDEARKGLSSLLRFREVQGDVFREAARLAPDLASALDIGLTESYQRLGRALQDPATGMRSLRDAGLNVRDTQLAVVESLARTGDKASAQKLILDELTRSVGGAAGAENAGLYGASKQLGKAWDDLLKSFGQSDSFTRVAGAGLDATTSAVNRLGRAIRENAVGDSLLAFLTLGAVIPDPSIRQPAASGRIKGGPISPVDFGGETPLQVRLRELRAQIDYFEKRPLRPAKTAEPVGGFQDYESVISESVAGAIQGSDIVRANLLARAIEKLDNLFFDAGLDAQTYESAMRKLTGTTDNLAQSTKTVSEEESRLQSLLALTDSGKTAKFLDTVDFVNRMEAAGRITGEIADEIIMKFNGARRAVPEAVDKMSQFAIQAARNIESAFADGLFDLMQGKFDNLGTSFKAMIDRMVANALAAQLAEKLFGVGYGTTTNKMGGWVAFVGEIFSGLFKADGGPVIGGSPYIVGERGPELFVPNTSGNIVPNGEFGGGGVSITNMITVYANDANSFRESRGQVLSAIGAATGRAARRYS